MRKEIPAIDLTSLDDLKAQKDIINKLMKAACDVGFFNICNHGIPESEIKGMFGLMEEFFALPTEVKESMPVDPDTYLGWERNAEISPATGPHFLRLNSFILYT
jgi:isopenicillin N synthase-like dioxygenase